MYTTSSLPLLSLSDLFGSYRMFCSSQWLHHLDPNSRHCSQTVACKNSSSLHGTLNITKQLIKRNTKQYDVCHGLRPFSSAQSRIRHARSTRNSVNISSTRFSSFGSVCVALLQSKTKSDQPRMYIHGC